MKCCLKVQDHYTKGKKLANYTDSLYHSSLSSILYFLPNSNILLICMQVSTLSYLPRNRLKYSG